MANLKNKIELRIRDLTLDFFIGIRPHEREKKQRVIINLWMYISYQGRLDSERMEDYVSYSDIIGKIKEIANSDRHVELVENLAEQIADIALADERIDRLIIDVNKPNIIPEAAGVGVKIERVRGEQASSS
ncbi:MAG: dihydroneopterin aldolase [bacterium]|nr:dihydroneopterin aldolase [bacterium]